MIKVPLLMAFATLGLSVTTRVIAKDSRSLVATPDFCRHLTETFAALETARGVPQRVALHRATLVQSQFIGEMTAGSLPAWISSTHRAADGSARFWESGQILMNAMGGLAQGEVLLTTTTTDDLRFLPNAQTGSHILLVTNTLGALTADRASRVLEAASVHRARISVIWTGGPSKDSAILMGLALGTRGRMTVLPPAGCGRAI